LIAPNLCIDLIIIFLEHSLTDVAATNDSSILANVYVKEIGRVYQNAYFFEKRTVRARSLWGQRSPKSADHRKTIDASCVCSCFT